MQNNTQKTPQGIIRCASAETRVRVPSKAAKLLPGGQFKRIRVDHDSCKAEDWVVMWVRVHRPDALSREAAQKILNYDIQVYENDSALLGELANIDDMDRLEIFLKGQFGTRRFPIREPSAHQRVVTELYNRNRMTHKGVIRCASGDTRVRVSTKVTHLLPGGQWKRIRVDTNACKAEDLVVMWIRVHRPYALGRQKAQKILNYDIEVYENDAALLGDLADISDMNSLEIYLKTRFKTTAEIRRKTTQKTQKTANIHTNVPAPASTTRTDLRVNPARRTYKNYQPWNAVRLNPLHRTPAAVATPRRLAPSPLPPVTNSNNKNVYNAAMALNMLRKAH